ncbi:MAG: YkgJ family cysteine cluster protein [Flavobacteriales bacterium]
MENTLKNLPQRAKEKYQETKKVFAKLKKKPPKHFDSMMVEIHDEVFEQIDCLDCVNCCKTTAPWITDKDIKRISKHFKIKEQRFIEMYLEEGLDHEFSFKKIPCVFLGEDHSCSIYDVRPKACREYPHTNRRKFQQISEITLKNVAICPAAFTIVEEMKKRLPVQYSKKGEKPKERFRRGGG